jgi:hypothetical protein
MDPPRPPGVARAPRARHLGARFASEKNSGDPAGSESVLSKPRANRERVRAGVAIRGLAVGRRRLVAVRDVTPL